MTRLASEPDWVDRSVVRPVAEPVFEVGGLVALFGRLAPGGAILKRSAADARLFEHEGRAVVFASLEDLAARIDDPDLEVTPDDVLVLQNAGPKSGTGMPEAGYLPIPAKLARAGVKDMIRISDARMSGTAFGTIVLHVTPEAALGGPLGLVRSGDRIRLSVAERRLDLLVAEHETRPPARGLARRTPDARARLREALPRPRPAGGSGLRLRFPAGVTAGLKNALPLGSPLRSRRTSAGRAGTRRRRSAALRRSAARTVCSGLPRAGTAPARRLRARTLGSGVRGCAAAPRVPKADQRDCGRDRIGEIKEAFSRSIAGCPTTARHAAAATEVLIGAQR